MIKSLKLEESNSHSSQRKNYEGDMLICSAKLEIDGRK